MQAETIPFSRPPPVQEEIHPDTITNPCTATTTTPHHSPTLPSIVADSTSSGGDGSENNMMSVSASSLSNVGGSNEFGSLGQTTTTATTSTSSSSSNNANQNNNSDMLITTTGPGGGGGRSRTGTATSTTGKPTTRSRRVSSFDVSLLPSLSMRKRELHAFSVHYSVATASYVATIARPEDTAGGGQGDSPHVDPTTDKRRCSSFSFPSERDARRFAKAYSPPKHQTGSLACVCCGAAFIPSAVSSSTCTAGAAHSNTATSPSSDSIALVNTTATSGVGGIGILNHANITSNHHSHHHKGCVRSFHCKNCGSQICDKCSRRWGIRMLPKTFHNNVSSLTVRVCRSCDWLSNSFCMALLQGQYDDAIALYSTGNVNLRTTFAHIHKEAMFPIHCAVMGGSLSLVKWMVESHDVPLSVRKTKMGIPLSVQTSKSRTLVDLAMTGRPKIDILGYLVSKNLSVMDCKDQSLAPKTLQALLRAGYHKDGNKSASSTTSSSLVSGIDTADVDGDLQSLLSRSSHDSVTTIEDACIICCERQMDCVLTPCGHQVCCADCGGRLKQCPVCKTDCTLIRIKKV